MDYKYLHSQVEEEAQGKPAGLFIPDHLYWFRLNKAKDVALKLIHNPTSVSLLDLGCGYGDFQFVAKDDLVIDSGTLVDGTEWALDTAKEKYERLTHLEFLNRNLQDINDLRNNYDLVLSLGVIAYMHNDAVRTHLNSAISRLAPKGVIVISVQDSERYGGKMFSLSMQDLIHHVTNACMSLGKYIDSIYVDKCEEDSQITIGVRVV